MWKIVSVRDFSKPHDSVPSLMEDGAGYWNMEIERINWEPIDFVVDESDRVFESKYPWNGIGEGFRNPVFGAAGISVVEHVRLEQQQGLSLFTVSSNVVLAESYHSKQNVARVIARKLKQECELITEFKRPPTRPANWFTRTVYNVAAAFERNHYHFLFEVLARLQYRDMFPELARLPILHPPLHQGYKELMEFFGGEMIQIPSEGMDLRRVVIPGPTHPHNGNKQSAEWLRAKLLSWLGLGEPPRGKKRILINRNNDSHCRHIENMLEVIQLSKKFGFEVYTLGFMPLRLQLELFTQADVVVGVHGAGLANTFVSPRECTVLELASTVYGPPCFYHSCKTLGQRYGRMLFPCRNTKQQNIHVDLLQLENMLARITR